MFLARRPGDRWELRESRLTSAGPRSRTIATFRELTPDTVSHAMKRSSGTLDPSALRALCRRAGAPVTPLPQDAAAAELLSAIARGERPRRGLARVLAAELNGGQESVSASERAAARWVHATTQQRGDTLRDLLLLTDR